MRKYAIIFLALCSIYGCERDCIEVQDEYSFLPLDLKNSVPYQNGQTVTFNRAGEVYAFLVDMQIDTVKTVVGVCDGCCKDTVFEFEEQLFVELHDTAHDVKFTMLTRGQYPTMFIDIYPFSTGQHANASSTLHYRLDQDGEFICNFDSTISNNGTICRDTVTIGSTLYSNVAEMRHQFGWFYDTRKVFYSKEKGILRVTFRNDLIDEIVFTE